MLLKLGAFYHNLFKIHPIYDVIGQLCDESPPDHFTKICEKTPQKAGTYTYTMSVWEPPG